MYLKNPLSWLVGVLTLLSVVVLVAWQFRPVLVQYHQPNYLGCNPVTAISFLLLAIAFRAAKSSSGKNSFSLIISATLLGVVALLKIADLFLASPVKVDEWLFQTVLSGTRYSYPAAICFLLFGLLLLLYAMNRNRHGPYVLLILIPVFLLCLFSWFGFVLNDRLLLGTLPFAPMSLLTTALFTISLIISVRLFPDRWIVNTVSSPRLGGIIARKLLPWLGIIPLLIFLGRQYWERRHYLSKDFAISAELTLLFAVLCLVVIRLTRTINDIDERERAHLHTLRDQADQLRVANESLQLSYEEMEQFTFAASHDLQEPLRKIMTYSGMIQQLEQTPAGGYQQRITDTAQRMANLLKALLHHSQLKADYRKEPVSLSIIFAEVRQDLELLINQLGADVQIEPLPIVHAVPHQMHQLFFNLLSNALKFTHPDRPPIVIIKATTDAEKGVHITVRDNGIGFDPEKTDQLFQVFKRLHSTKRYPGTGLGLSLCKKIVKSHGGQIWAENNPETGATFHVVLPDTMQ